MSIRVSAIVSLYNSERFVRGAMQDLVAQTLFQRGEMEIVVVNSGSQEGEEPIVLEYKARHPNIKYVRTERETIYGAWNRGVALSEGQFLTNANSDDRHRADALEVLANALERSGAGTAYADAYITRGANEPFENNTADRVFNWPDYSLRQLLMHSLVGPQPMWRRDLHDHVGLFNANLKIAGDYDFFIRAGWARGGIHVRKVLGLYYEGGTEHRNLDRTFDETTDILRRYRSMIPIEDIYPACRASSDPHVAGAVARWDFAGCLSTGPHKDVQLATRLRSDAVVAVLRRPASWPALGLLRLRFALNGPYTGRGTGPWHPVLDELPPLVDKIIRPIR
ncbi:MAG: glycosyltransferase [Gammaproteobacteria bacterium]